MGHVVDKCYKLHGYPPGYKFKDKGQASTNSIVISAIDNIVDDNVSLTRTKYQLFLSLLNSQSHFGTQGPQDLASKSHQVANIIAQPTMGFAGHEMLGISFQNLSKLSINSLEYSVFLHMSRLLSLPPLTGFFIVEPLIIWSTLSIFSLLLPFWYIFLSSYLMVTLYKSPI